MRIRRDHPASLIHEFSCMARYVANDRAYVERRVNPNPLLAARASTSSPRTTVGGGTMSRMPVVLDRPPRFDRLRNSGGCRSGRVLGRPRRAIDQSRGGVASRFGCRASHDRLAGARWCDEDAGVRYEEFGAGSLRCTRGSASQVCWGAVGLHAAALSTAPPWGSSTQTSWHGGDHVRKAAVVARACRWPASRAPGAIPITG